MTPKLDQLLKKWFFYKRALIFCLVVSVFSVSVSAVLSFNYFGFKKNLIRKERSSIEKIKDADQFITKTQNLIHATSQQSTFDLRNPKEALKILNVLGQWQDVKNLSKKIGIEWTVQEEAVLSDVKNNVDLQALLNQASEIKAAELQLMDQSFARFDTLQKELILSGLLTLVFGFLLPLLAFYTIGRTLNKIRFEIQRTALEIVRDWGAATVGAKDDAFKSVDFWLQILLLAGQQASQLSSHPVAQICGELSQVIRLELQKKQKNEAVA